MLMRYIRDALPLMRSLVAYAAMPAAGIITAPILAHALGATGRGQLAGISSADDLGIRCGSAWCALCRDLFHLPSNPADKVLRWAVIIALIMTVIVGTGVFFYSTPIAAQLDTNRILILMIWSAFLPSAFIAIRRGHIQGLRRYGLLDLERMLRPPSVSVPLSSLGYRREIVIAFAAVYMIAGQSASAMLRLPRDAASSREFVGQGAGIKPDFTGHHSCPMRRCPPSEPLLQPCPHGLTRQSCPRSLPQMTWETIRSPYGGGSACNYHHCADTQSVGGNLPVVSITSNRTLCSVGRFGAGGANARDSDYTPSSHPDCVWS